MKKYLLSYILIAVVFAGLGFWGGLTFGQKRNALNLGGQAGRGARQFQARVNQGVGVARGEIIGADEKSITVKLRDGSSKIVFISDTTTIAKAGEGSKTDLVKGKQVMITGKDNPDGSLTAQNVQLDPFLDNPPATGAAKP